MKLTVYPYGQLTKLIEAEYGASSIYFSFEELEERLHGTNITVTVSGKFFKTRKIGVQNNNGGYEELEGSILGLQIHCQHYVDYPLLTRVPEIWVKAPSNSEGLSTYRFKCYNNNDKQTMLNIPKHWSETVLDALGYQPVEVALPSSPKLVVVESKALFELKHEDEKRPQMIMLQDEFDSKIQLYRDSALQVQTLPLPDTSSFLKS